jgi:hypothetical protein
MAKATTVGNGDLSKSLRQKGAKPEDAHGLKDIVRTSMSQTPPHRRTMKSSFTVGAPVPPRRW